MKILQLLSFTNAVEGMKDDDDHYNLKEDGLIYRLTYDIEYANEIENVVETTTA